MPRVSVAEAVAIRDGGVDRRELDVAGFLSRVPVLACPMILANRNPTRLDCPQSFQWLMANPEQLEHATANGSTFGPPSGPAFRLSFTLVDLPTPAEWRAAADQIAPPAPVELIGHFDDRRAALCAPDRDSQLRCSDTFVADQVVSVDGQPVGVATSEDLVGADGARVQPASTVEEVDRLVEASDPGVVILSRRVVDADRLTYIEPGVDGVAIGTPVIWSVVGVDPGTGPGMARSFLVPDGGSDALPLSDVGSGFAPSPQPGPS